MKVKVNGEVKVSVVVLVWLDGDDSIDLLTLLDSEVVVKVEHCLLPVSVPCIWGGGEAQFVDDTL